MRSLVSVVAMLLAAPAPAETLYCSTWQGIRTCSSPGGYVSHESQWQGMTTGDDNQGNHWTSWRWQGTDITTGTPPGR